MYRVVFSTSLIKLNEILSLPSRDSGESGSPVCSMISATVEACSHHPGTQRQGIQFLRGLREVDIIEMGTTKLEALDSRNIEESSDEGILGKENTDICKTRFSFVMQSEDELGGGSRDKAREIVASECAQGLDLSPVKAQLQRAWWFK